jgi:hypothetical protein
MDKSNDNKRKSSIHPTKTFSHRTSNKRSWKGGEHREGNLYAKAQRILSAGEVGRYRSLFNIRLIVLASVLNCEFEKDFCFSFLSLIARTLESIGVEPRTSGATR